MVLMKSFPGGLAPIALALAMSLPANAAPNEASVIAPTSGPWNASEGFKFEKKERKTRQSMSGVACPTISSGQHICLAVFDEGTEARYLVIRDNAYTVDNERVILRSGAGELDAEA